MPTAAQLMVKCLENEGVSVVFGLPGEENIRFIQALAASSIRYILTRHEQGAAFMAEMYGRVTGRAAVVSATLGPGAINMQLGVADATTNSTPLVAISAQVGQDREYKESHQYVDLVSMFAPITRWADGVPTSRAIPEMFRKAFKVAETERPAAVYLAVPEHIDADETDYDLAPLPRNVVRAEAPSAAQVQRAVEVSAQRQAAGGAGGPRCRARRRHRGTGSLLRRPRRSGGKHLPRQGRDARRSPQQHRHHRLHAPRLRELRVRERRRHRRGRIRAAGVRPGPDQPERRQEDHPHPSVSGRGRHALPGVGRNHRRHQRVAERTDRSTGRASLRQRRCCARTQAARRGVRTRDNEIRDFHSPRSASLPTPAPRSAAATSCWSTPGQRKCGWRGFIRPTNAIPA